MVCRRMLIDGLKVAYTDCSTTSGVLSLDPYELRYNNKTPGFIYGNSGMFELLCLGVKSSQVACTVERYNYDASVAFNYSTYPVSRFVNEFG